LEQYGRKKWLIPVCYFPVAVGGQGNCAYRWDPITDFGPQVLLKTNPAWHQRPNENPACPYNAVCWIHMEE
jgi:hypothetical protein